MNVLTQVVLAIIATSAVIVVTAVAVVVMMAAVMAVTAVVTMCYLEKAYMQTATEGRLR